MFGFIVFAVRFNMKLDDRLAEVQLFVAQVNKYTDVCYNSLPEKWAYVSSLLTVPVWTGEQMAAGLTSELQI